MPNFKQLDRIKEVKRRWKIIAIVSLVFLLLDITLYYGVKHYFPDAWKKEEALLDIHIKANDKQHAIETALADNSLSSEYAVLIDMEDNLTLYEKNADDKIYPASMTKVLTAIVALDACDDLAAKENITYEDLAGLIEENASVAGFQVGDSLSYEQALYGVILPSAADAANFLANHLYGSVPEYVNAMNKKAQALGMKNSHFVNTIGLHDDNHYTTLNDMKKMMIHAWKNPAFQKIMTTLKYTITGLDSHPDGLSIQSSLRTYGGGNLGFQGGEIIGGKSGYTPEAECCLISIAKMDDGHLYMLITAKASGDPRADQNHLKDAKKVYETIASASNQK